MLKNPDLICYELLGIANEPRQVNLLKVENIGSILEIRLSVNAFI